MSIIRQESRFDQRGKSPARAQGLMQMGQGLMGPMGLSQLGAGLSAGVQSLPGIGGLLGGVR